MIRGKQPEANLRLTYRKMLWSCVGASVAIHGVIFALFPTFEADAYAKSEDPVIIQLEEIPETKQERRPPPPARPTPRRPACAAAPRASPPCTSAGPAPCASRRAAPTPTLRAPARRSGAGRAAVGWRAALCRRDSSRIRGADRSSEGRARRSMVRRCPATR